MSRKITGDKIPGEKESEKEKESHLGVECMEILETLSSIADPERTAGMGRYGINTERALGVSMPLLRQTKKKLGKSHSLALELWASGIHEARILACMVEEPALV
jgi:3-methyladenine DNA glycosylase AlkD